jgi:hypothetical protein
VYAHAQVYRWRAGPTTLLSTATFMAGNSPLFLPDVDDEDEKTVKLAKAALVLSPIQSVLSWRGTGTGTGAWIATPGSPLRCKSSSGVDVDMGEPAMASMSKRGEEGDASVETPAGSLPAPSDDNEETRQEGSGSHG